MMKKLKMIGVSESNWNYLHDLKRSLRMRSIDELMDHIRTDMESRMKEVPLK